MQLVIPALQLIATPPSLFVQRMRVEQDALKKSCSEVYALEVGRMWLQMVKR